MELESLDPQGDDVALDPVHRDPEADLRVADPAVVHVEDGALEEVGVGEVVHALRGEAIVPQVAAAAVAVDQGEDELGGGAAGGVERVAVLVAEVEEGGGQPLLRALSEAERLPGVGEGEVRFGSGLRGGSGRLRRRYRGYRPLDVDVEEEAVPEAELWREFRIAGRAELEFENDAVGGEV